MQLPPLGLGRDVGRAGLGGAGGLVTGWLGWLGWLVGLWCRLEVLFVRSEASQMMACCLQTI